MTGQGAEPLAPNIRIDVDCHGVRVRQQRPAIASSLVGMAASAALRLVPVMLPICGRAQAVAAQRAVAAAQGDSNAPAANPAEPILWREQAFAAAWRYCVDWPDLLGEPRRMEDLAAVRGAANDAACSAALARLTPGIERVQSVDQLLDWARASDTVAGRLAAVALESGGAVEGCQCLAGEALVQTAATAFARRAFDPLSPWDSPLEVGPLAMERDPLVAAVRAHLGASIAGRILAQILDSRAICAHLAAAAAPAEAAVDAWLLEAGVGMGRAMTSRGPVFHRVSLQGSSGYRVADWRVLAPTDWHFAPRGPVVAGIAQIPDPGPDRMRLLVISYDPCAPWSLHCDPDGG